MKPRDRTGRAALAVALVLAGWAEAGGAAPLLPTASVPLPESPAVRQLRAAKRLRHFLDKTDSEIAARIASESGLRAQVDATAPARRVVVQRNLTDWQFLEQLAQRNGFRFWYAHCQHTTNCFSQFSGSLWHSKRHFDSNTDRRYFSLYV